MKRRVVNVRERENLIAINVMGMDNSLVRIVMVMEKKHVKIVLGMEMLMTITLMEFIIITY